VVRTGELRPDELNVELYYGKMRHLDRIDTPRVKMMRVKEEHERQLPLQLSAAMQRFRPIRVHRPGDSQCRCMDPLPAGAVDLGLKGLAVRRARLTGCGFPFGCVNCRLSFQQGR
jgi:hypothetical protein